MYYQDFSQVSTAMFFQKFPACPSYRSISKGCLSVSLGNCIVVLPAIPFRGHSCRSSVYHSLPCLSAGSPDRSCAEVQDLDLASHRGLEVEVEEDPPVWSRRDLARTGDCCD
jgi:hypothetical protein